MHKKLTNLEDFALTNDIAALNNYEMCQQIHDGKLLIEFNKNISHHRHSQISARYRTCILISPIFHKNLSNFHFG